MLKKGQAAMEFLMTYGWAILVVLAAIGALAYFGVFNMGGVLPDRCTTPVGFSCVDLKADSTDDKLRFAVINNQDTNLFNAEVTFTLQTGDVCPRISPADVVASFNNGDRMNLEFDCGEINEGQNLQGSFVIAYESEGGENLQETGDVRVGGQP